MTPAPRPRDIRLFAYVALGVAAGALYVVFDLLSEARLKSGTLTGFLADAHDVIDHTSPLLVGGLLGVCAHYLRLRAQLSAAQEAAARAEALRTRLQKVERDQAVWVLAAAVLHELNNPLHALGLLLDELAGSDGDHAHRSDLVERARAQTERALKHLEALRSMRSLGEPEFQRIALDRVVAGVAGDMAALAAEDGLRVRAECSQTVQARADPMYVRTIVENLLDNGLHSARAAGAGGGVSIRVDSENGRAVVRVTDDGPPLDEAAREALFEPLSSTKTQGLGLGLSIARALARAMRGDLVLEKSENKAFRLELPGGF
ncbi:MAG TPA: HAMP domain-containing sensor histidine kinase [Polyangiaceae bacterium]|jgi:signal transduction histidine kinase